jgi:hypothetical protein
VGWRAFLQALNMEQDKDKLARLHAAFPGRKIKIEGTEIEVMVMPLRAANVAKFQDVIANVAASAKSLILDALGTEKADDGKTAGQILDVIRPMLSGELLGLVQEGVDVDLLQVPHFVLPQIIGAWIEENFAGNRVAGWLALGKKMLGIIQPADSSTSSTSSGN